MREAIILAGGKGERLRSVVSDIPKPMAEVNNRPFLSYILDYLHAFNIQRVILSVGYKWEIIQEEYKDSYKGMEIAYAVENTPLGTGGGIAKALNMASQESVLILNGDSFIGIDIDEFYSFHREKNGVLSIGVKEMYNFSRYGSVILEEGIKGSEEKSIESKDRILEFCEKKEVDKGFINTGAYIANKDLFSGLNLGERFSFENDYLNKEVKREKIYGYKTNGYFIDIGIPEDYRRAEQELAKHINLT